MWKTVAVVLGLLIVGALVFVWLKGIQFYKMFSGEAAQVLADANILDRPVVKEEELEGLPEPVRRYFKYTGIIGKDRINFMRLKHRGTMRIAPDKEALPIVGTQYFSADPPALLWTGKVKPSFFMSVSARDKYMRGKGNMLIKLMSAFIIADAKGPELDEGALQRFLGESAWFPTALLPGENLRWEAIDHMSARAILKDRDVKAEVTFYFNEIGQITRCSCPRYYSLEGGKGYEKRSWSGYLREYKEINGIRIPTDIEAVWHLEGGDYSYAHFLLETADYNVYEPYAD
jgi:hypothetical protein